MLEEKVLSQSPEMLSDLVGLVVDVLVEDLCRLDSLDYRIVIEEGPDIE